MISLHALPLRLRNSAAVRSSTIYLAAVMAVSCTGYIEAPPGSGDPHSSGGGSTTKGGVAGGTVISATGPIVSRPSAASRFVRLNHQQWENTVRDAFRLSASPGLATSFVAEPLRSTFDTNGSLLSVDADLWQDYQSAAEAVANKIAHDATLLAGFTAGAPADAAARSRAFVQNVGLRAFRRPLNDDEVTLYSGLFSKGPALVGSGDAFADGVELVLAAFLQSPHFLYRVELSTAVVDGKIPLGDYEVASRLSYGLANTMPDGELMAAAAAKKLQTRDGVIEQVHRLLGAPSSAEMVAGFHDQLLHMVDFEQVTKDTKLFPAFEPGVGADMREEAHTFAKNVIVEQDRGLAELLTAPYTFANSRLAKIYGLSIPTNGSPDELKRIELDKTQRSGLLTQLGFLTTHAEGQTPSIIHRGVNIAKKVLCVVLPPPPNMIPPLPAIAPNQTNRQRIATLTKDAPCNGCHTAFINPLGYAFETLDGVGKYRTQENGQPIDAASSYTLDGTVVSFNGPVELSKAIAASQVAHDCYARHWIEYLYGRELDTGSQADEELVAQAGVRSKSNVSVKNLIADVLATDAFLTRLP